MSSSPAPSYATQNTSIYKSYLHKRPHLIFTTIEDPPPSSFCMVCDDTNPFELYACVHCGLQLCGVCQFLITDPLIRGDLKRLIQHIARWKLGYSDAFLEREEAERINERQKREMIAKQEIEDGEIIQRDIDKLFERMIDAFKAENREDESGLVTEDC